MYDGDGLWDQVGWNADVEVVEVGLCEGWCVGIVVVVCVDELLDVVVDL